MTPYADPQEGPQQRYNSAHARTRVRVEQLFGMLKSRFQCLRGLRMRPQRAIQVIGACVMLHNFSLLRDDVYDMDINMHVPQNANLVRGNELEDGRALREHVANTFFAH